VNGLSLGFATARSRLDYRFVTSLAVVAFAAVAGDAALERRAAPLHAVDATLAGAVFGLCIPLVAFAIVSRASTHGKVEDSVWPVARLGMDRRAAVLGLLSGAAFSSALLAGALAFSGVLLGAAKVDAGILRDATQSAWIGALGGAVYVAWFGLGSLFGRAGGGRYVALAVDWIAGGTTTAFAVPWPRAHLRSLIGGDLVHFMSERQSTAALYVLLVSYLVLCSLRVQS